MYRHLIRSFCVLLCLLCVAACGKKGDPLPQKIDQLFSWRNVYVSMNLEGMVSVSGMVAGASQNVRAVVLEMAPLDDACAGCPFVPLQIFPVNVNEMWESQGSSVFRFTVHPTGTAQAYRWRLVGHNIFNGLPEVVSPVRTVQRGVEQPPVE